MSVLFFCLWLCVLCFFDFMSLLMAWCMFFLCCYTIVRTCVYRVLCILAVVMWKMLVQKLPAYVTRR